MRAHETMAILTALVLCVAGCARSAGPPAIAVGTPCAVCGMEVRTLRFACERREAGHWRVYDSIECLIRDAGASPMAVAAAPRSRTIWLSDYDLQTPHAADSMWVVRGEFASPMGGGFAAFLDLTAADSIAAETRGRVDRLAAFMAAPVGPGR